jgi:hypothetical protein|tara:strand:- start:723 stop:1526 length:804 start_codon:yes stop_codon:yes gene_type:complete
MEKVRWRGTWGVGDFMHSLNVCHNYCFYNNTKVNLEMHWQHDEDYRHHPDDPETIIERMSWIHDQYYRQDDVVVTHVFNSDLFQSGNTNPDKQKDRFYFDSNAYDPSSAPPNDWVFKPEVYLPKKKKIVIWTPHYNSEPPRKWKRFLTKDDWAGIIKLLRWKGWILVELTYRTPVRDAFKQIQEADFIFCYDGMWHYIARNFSKAMFIPSWEGITKYNTPMAMTRPNKEGVLDFIQDGGEGFEPNLTRMKDKSNDYIRMMQERYYDK